MSILLWLATGCAATYAWVQLDHAHDARKDRSLGYVYQRETALDTLARFHAQQRHPSQWNTCKTCGGNVLTENTDHGVCADCMEEA